MRKTGESRYPSDKAIKKSASSGWRISNSFICLHDAKIKQNEERERERESVRAFSNDGSLNEKFIAPFLLPIISWGRHYTAPPARYYFRIIPRRFECPSCETFPDGNSSVLKSRGNGNCWNEKRKKRTSHFFHGLLIIGLRMFMHLWVFWRFYLSRNATCKNRRVKYRANRAVLIVIIHWMNNLLFWY